MNIPGIEAAIDLIGKGKRNDDNAAATLNALVGMGARVTLRPSTNTIRLYGITGTCNWSQDRGLIQSWYENACKRMMARAFQSLDTSAN